MNGRLLARPRSTLDTRPTWPEDLAALRLGLAALAEQVPAWHVQAGDLVTTGTPTDAWPVAAGEVWRTAPDDACLARLSLRFTG